MHVSECPALHSTCCTGSHVLMWQVSASLIPRFIQRNSDRGVLEDVDPRPRVDDRRGCLYRLKQTPSSRNYQQKVPAASTRSRCSVQFRIVLYSRNATNSPGREGAGIYLRLPRDNAAHIRTVSKPWYFTSRKDLTLGTYLGRSSSSPAHCWGFVQYKHSAPLLHRPEGAERKMTD